MRIAPALAVLLVSATGHANKEKLAPGLAEIVAAERAFAKRCGEVGIRDSFLEFFAADGVSFAPDPGLAHARLEKRPKKTPDPTVELDWAPMRAEISAAGDLGWTSGNATFERSSKEPKSMGYYFSLWRKQPDGGWKVVLDIGVDSPPKAFAKETVVTPLGPKSSAPPAAVDAAAIKKLDAEFCARSATDAPAAYRAALADNAVRNHQGLLPATSKKAILGTVKKGGRACTPSEAFVSTGLAYTYGSWEGDGEKGYYARVWRWDGDWRIAAEVDSLLK